jgi:hypothetical protein
MAEYDVLAAGEKVFFWIAITSSLIAHVVDLVAGSLIQPVEGPVDLLNMSLALHLLIPLPLAEVGSLRAWLVFPQGYFGHVLCLFLFCLSFEWRRLLGAFLFISCVDGEIVIRTLKLTLHGV